jgi:hypothetical protein
VARKPLQNVSTVYVPVKSPTTNCMSTRAAYYLW